MQRSSLTILFFKLAFDHFCIHVGGRAVTDELQKNFLLSNSHVEASREHICCLEPVLLLLDAFWVQSLTYSLLGYLSCLVLVLLLAHISRLFGTVSVVVIYYFPGCPSGADVVSLTIWLLKLSTLSALGCLEYVRKFGGADYWTEIGLHMNLQILIAEEKFYFLACWIPVAVWKIHLLASCVSSWVRHYLLHYLAGLLGNSHCCFVPALLSLPLSRMFSGAVIDTCTVRLPVGCSLTHSWFSGAAVLDV